MSEKERLEKIKDRYMPPEYDYALYNFDIDFLIAQAEEKIILEQKVKDLEEQFSFSGKFVDKKYQRLQEEKIQLEERIEKLEEELYELNESAIETQNDFLDTNGEKNRLLEQNQHYKQALEEIYDNYYFVPIITKIVKKVLQGDSNG